MNNTARPKVWFYAKEYGWGWGAPARWEGWAVLIGYVLLIVGGIVFFLPTEHLLGYLLYVGALTMALIAICLATGEQPRWRWGEASEGTRKAQARWLLLGHLFLGPLLLVISLFFHANPPAEINESYGYRTVASMHNQVMWDKAQRFSAVAMAGASVLVIAFQVLSIFTMKPLVALVSSTLVTVIAIFASIALTEAHLKSFQETVTATNTPLFNRE